MSTPKFSVINILKAAKERKEAERFSVTKILKESQANRDAKAVNQETINRAIETAEGTLQQRRDDLDALSAVVSQAKTQGPETIALRAEVQRLTQELTQQKLTPDALTGPSLAAVALPDGPVNLQVMRDSNGRIASLVHELVRFDVQRDANMRVQNVRMQRP